MGSEMNFVIAEALAMGNSYSEKHFGYDRLEYSQNMLPTEYGMGINDVPLLVTEDWPFPTVKEDLTLASTGVTCYKQYSRNTAHTVTAGTAPWHIAKRHADWVAVNGTSILWYTSWSKQQDNKVLGATWSSKSVCFFRDRLVFTGVAASEIESEYVDAWRETLPVELYPHDTYSTNWLIYGPRASVDDKVQHYMFLAMLGVYDWTLLGQELNGDGLVKENILSLIERGEIGFVPLTGETHTLLPFRDTLVCYGEQIHIVSQADNRLIHNVTRDIGVWTAGGNENFHLFVADDGRLHLFNSDGMQDLDSIHITSDDQIVVFDERKGRFWLSDGVDSYCITTDGRIGGPFEYGVASVTGPLHSTPNKMYATAPPELFELELCTRPFDTADRGTKHVSALQIGIAGEYTGAQSQVVWSQDDNMTFNWSPWVPVNNHGVSFPRVSFHSGKVKMKATSDDENFYIKRIEVRYQAEDRRYRRGTKGFSSVPQGGNAQDAP